MGIPISAVIISLNEERNIARSVKSCSWADEIIVVDSGSQDRTIEIAKSLGAIVVSEKWRGFGPQKKFAAQQAKNDWILSLDADEEVSAELKAEIEARFRSFKEEIGYLLPRKSFYLGRWILHGGWYPDFQLRIFNRKRSQWDDKMIHEKVKSKVEEKMQAPLNHYVFRNIYHQVETNNRYSGLQSEALILSQQNKLLVFKMLLKPPSKFLECYFLKLGFLDGIPGFVIAIGAAYSVFLRWAKVWEAQMSSRDL